MEGSFGRFPSPVAAWSVCGLLAFALNLIFGWSRFGGAKDPLTQPSFVANPNNRQ
jgi:hypothetical protein